MKVTKRFLPVALTIIIAVTFFLFLYNYDNKYQYDSVQPINGHLILSEQDIESNDYQFLINGWEFYPNRLLSPDDFESGEPEYYKTFVSIGETTRFTPDNNDSPYGCGTYVLYLHLPEEFNTYAIQIPEVFSAYRMYIDENEVLSVGTPEKDNYSDSVAARIITFDHSGSNEVRLIISASNYSYLYGGMVYPPTFGKPEALNYIRGLRVIIAVIINIIMVITIIISLYFGVKFKNSTPFLFALLCAFASIFMLYPITHMIFVLSIFPYYTIELVSGYVAMMLIVILYNKICDIDNRIKIATAILSAVFCTLVLIYGLFAFNITASIADAFSVASLCYKLLVAGYIILSCNRITNTYTQNSRLIYYATIFFACACISDRLMPLYEPIFGIWFTEWGITLIVVAIGYEYAKDMLLRFEYNLEFQEEHRQALRQLDMQIEYSKQIKEQTNKNRKLIHDFRQHLRVIHSMADNHDTNSITDYLDNIARLNITSSKLPNIDFCDNTAIDALLRYYAGAMQNEQIDVKFRLALPNKLSISDVDFCTVLGNLLENALEACKKIEPEQRKILLSSSEQGSNLFVVIKNTYNGEIRQVGKRFVSTKTKAQRFGIGVSSAEQIVNAHGGTFTVSFDESTFQVGITIPMN